MIEITFPEGRIVSGHPMKGFTPTDDKTKLPKMRKDGITKVVEWSFGVAIPKAGTTDWRQTPWGAQVNQAAQDAVDGYTLAETQSKFFSWKIVDGDSTEPNRKGNKPCEQEGYPGHWVVFMSTQFQAPKCFHKDKYDPMQQIQNDSEIEKGDYVRVHCSVRGNKPSQTAGVYINPGIVSLERKGTPIVSASAGPSAASVFGGAPSAPAPVAPPAATGVPVPPPATDLLVTPPPVEEKYLVDGVVYNKATLLTFPGFTESVIASLPRA